MFAAKSGVTSPCRPATLGAVETEPQAWLEAAGGRKVPVQGNCSFGRAVDNTVVLPDDRVSRRHAIVHAQGAATGHNEFWLVDLGSANGTYVNGRRVAQPCRLTDRDEIRIANHTFSFRIPLSAGATQAAHADKTVQDIKTVECWLLVADIEGSTEFARKLAPEEAPRVTGRWLAQCKQVIEESSGAVNKYLGDGFLAYWPGARDAAKNVANALKHLKALQEQGAPRFRIVLHQGKVFVGGGGSMGEESLMGNEVNFVFRMEKLAGSAGQPRLMSAPAVAAIEPHMIAGDEIRKGLPGFEGEFTFAEF
jgi:class 3 adenylate cyclase